MDVNLVYVDDVLAGEIPFLLDSFDQLPKVSTLREHTPKIAAVRVICRKPGLPRDFEEMSGICAEASAHLAFDKRLVGERRPWLFVAGDTWLPDTRVVRHKKMWREVARRYGIEASGAVPEASFESAEGVRFATMVELSPDSFVKGMRLLRGMRSSAVELVSGAKRAG